MKSISHAFSSGSWIGSSSDKGEVLLLWLMGGYVVLVPGLSLVPGVGPFNEKRALQIGVLVAAGVVLLVFSASRRRWMSMFTALPSLAKYGLGTVLELGVLSAALAPASLSAFFEVGHFVLLFAAAGVVASAVYHLPEQSTRLLLGVVIFSSFLYCVYFSVRYGGSLVLPALEVGRETVSGFVNTRFFNQYQTWTLPLLGGAVLVLPQKWRVSRGFVFFLTAVWWMLVLATNVRGTVLAMVIATLGVGLLFREHSYRWVGVQVAALVGGSGLYFILFYLGGEVSLQVAERFGQVGQSRRLQHWAKCLDMAWMHPWLGVGPMHYAWPPYDYAVAAHPHNAFLQWLAEWGIPSTALMSGLAIWGGWSWIQQERDNARTDSTSSNGVRVSLVAAVLAGTAHAMVSGLLVMPVSQMFFVLVGGWAWGRFQRSWATPDDDKTVSVRVQIALCVVLVASMAVVGSSLRALGTVEERRAAFRNSVERQLYSPRYWGQGYIGVRDSSVIKRARRDR